MLPTNSGFKDKNGHRNSALVIQTSHGIGLSGGLNFGKLKQKIHKLYME